MSDRKMEVADAAVVVHLVQLIQDSPDVRYHVGGWGTRMRDLLSSPSRRAGSSSRWTT